jgi:predicted  nucleic acid-binding Zn-ribbon protein
MANPYFKTAASYIRQGANAKMTEIHALQKEIADFHKEKGDHINSLVSHMHDDNAKLATRSDDRERAAIAKEEMALQKEINNTKAEIASKTAEINKKINDVYNTMHDLEGKARDLESKD